MKGTLAPAHPEVQEFTATVEQVDGTDVVLDETYFYAESGGQPADRGTIAGHAVADVQTRNGDVVHSLEAEPEFSVGDQVYGAIDADFRTYCMRAHTASHALYGAGRQLLEELGYGGFDIDSEKVRVDLTTPTTIDDETLVELERLTNRAVWESRAVSWERVPVGEARNREEVAFNTKTEEGVMADSDVVRVVTIEGWDWAACGGTHVSNTREIGPVSVLERSNPGEGLTRVEFAVGPVGIDRGATVHETARAAARELGVAVEDLDGEVARLRTELEESESRLADLKAEVLEARMSELNTVERDGETWRVGVVQGFGPNEVGQQAQSLVGQMGAVIAVVGDDDTPFVVIAGDGSTNAGEVVDRVTDEFGGGGGGGPTFAQGGGLDATPEEVVDFLRS